MKVRVSQFLSVLFAVAIALSVATHAYSQPTAPIPIPSTSPAIASGPVYPRPEPSYTAKWVGD